MNSIVKPYLFKASLLAGLALILGLALSIIIYLSTEKVRINAIDLVDNRIPILTSINQLYADLSEQERVIYEYYRSQNGEPFLLAFDQNVAAFKAHTKALQKQNGFDQQMQFIVAKQQEIENLSKQFHDAMQLNEDNWDHLRDLLTLISNARRDILPKLREIELLTEQTVEQAHQTTLGQMEQTHWTVIIYGVSIVLLAGVVSYYIRQYIFTNVQNTRLALFPQRNPNPIISINNVGEIVFSNPATEELLEDMGFNKGDTEKLVPANFLALRQELSQLDETTLVVEQELSDRIIQTNINWHKELDAYDIHIVDITQRKLAEQKVKHIAFYDQETNLPNQYKLNNDLDELIDNERSLSLGVFEVKDFNKIVTAIGVESTGELIKVLAKVVVSNLPPNTHLYQLNDSQFAMLAEGKYSHEQLFEFTEAITAISENPLNTHCGEFFVEMDFGYCQYPEHGFDRNSLYKNAHTALGISSNDEHSHFTLYQDDYGQAIAANAAMVDNLRHAIELNELFLVFQPQLDLTQNKITGAETLIRWRHDDKIVSPAEFIPIAEQSGLIVPIGKWILEQACLFAKSLIAQGYHDIVIAVNVSPRQFSHPSFIEMVTSVIKQVGIAANHIELEITEGVIMHNEQETLNTLHQLKEFGFQLSIDDFGTGYSSLSYLKRFPVDKLKIDQSFIRDSHQNEEDKTLVKTIVNMGKSLGLSLIAEGVEEKEHVDFLTEIGCDEIQGYWFSRPLEQADLVAFLTIDRDSKAS